MEFIIVARTSGEEKSTGQDIRAQVAEVAASIASRGDTVLRAFSDDEGVSGDSDPFTRDGLRAALALARETGAALAFREFARFSRAYPPRALLWFDRLGEEGVRVLCLADPEFSTVGAEPAEPDPMLVGMRMMKSIFGWSYLVSTRTGTQRAMDGIKAGTRKTRSGRRPGRPSVIERMTEEETEWARAQLDAGAALTQVHKELLQRRGFNDLVNPKARKARAISYDSLARALGRRSAKADVPQNSEAPAENPVVRKGPLVRKAGRGQNTVPVETNRPATGPAAERGDTPETGGSA